MSDLVDIEPEYPHVQVFLEPLAGDELALAEAVATALDRSGHPLVADAFALTALSCRNYDELLLTARCLVTVI